MESLTFGLDGSIDQKILWDAFCDLRIYLDSFVQMSIAPANLCSSFVFFVFSRWLKDLRNMCKKRECFYQMSRTIILWLAFTPKSTLRKSHYQRYQLHWFQWLSVLGIWLLDWLTLFTTDCFRNCRQNHTPMWFLLWHEVWATAPHIFKRKWWYMIFCPFGCGFS